jgi:hypothetical protein
VPRSQLRDMSRSGRIGSPPGRLENSHSMSKVWAYFRLGVDLVGHYVRLSVNGAGSVARRVDEWARPRARALARRVAVRGARAARTTAITLVLVTAVLISNLARHLAKAIDRLAAVRERATTLILATLRAGGAFARQHRPRAPAVHTRASRSWWYGVEALAGPSASLRRLQRRLSVAVRTRLSAYVGRSSGPDRDVEPDHLGDVAAGEQQLAAIGVTSTQSVMSTGVRPSESSSSRISSR